MIIVAYLYYYVRLFSMFASTYQSCLWIICFNSLFAFSKLFVYYDYIQILHLVYGVLKYTIKKPILQTGAVIVTFHSLVVAFLLVYYVIIDNDNSTFAIIHQKSPYNLYTCLYSPPWWWIGLWSIFDVLANLLFLSLFMIPIRRIIQSGDQSRLVIAGFGIKYAILSLVLFFSTAIVACAFMFFDFNIISLDLLINSICLLLMEPYYPDKLYFNRLCSCCIFICDRDNYLKINPNATQSATAKASNPELNKPNKINNSPQVNSTIVIEGTLDTVPNVSNLLQISHDNNYIVESIDENHYNSSQIRERNFDTGDFSLQPSRPSRPSQTEVTKYSMTSTIVSTSTRLS